MINSKNVHWLLIINSFLSMEESTEKNHYLIDHLVLKIEKQDFQEQIQTIKELSQIKNDLIKTRYEKTSEDPRYFLIDGQLIKNINDVIIIFDRTINQFKED